MATPGPLRQSGELSLEYQAVRKNYRRLVEVVSRGNIPGALFETGVIGDTLMDPSTTYNLTQTQKGGKILSHVLNSIKLQPEKHFESLCQALKLESVEGIGEVLGELKRTFETLKQEQTCVGISSNKSSADGSAEKRNMYQQVKCELEVLQKLFNSACSSTDAKESAITLIKEQVQQFIGKSLESGLSISQVKSEINALCFKELVVPTILVDSVQEEFEEKSLKCMLKSALSEETVSAKCTSHEEETIVFSKDTLYHAGLCCEAVSLHQRENDVKMFFQSKSPMHSLEEISFSQNSLTKPYLIAKQGTTIYVAFRGETQLMKSGYDENLSSQASQIPVHFLTELLWSHHKVVLTGFSFGGMLACCVMANLWKESRISAETLLKQAVCIAFGLPFMKIQLIDQVLRMCPDLKKSIHSIFLKEDLVPQIMGYVSLAAAAQNEEMIAMKRGSQGTASSILASSTKRLGVMTQCLINLQKESLEKQKMYSEAASPTLRSSKRIMNDVKNLMTQIDNAPECSEDIVCLVYGACYVMSIDKQQGIIWGKTLSTTPKLLALQLTFNRKTLAKRIEQSLFKKHIIDHYNQMVLRSYLDKPEKYTPPSRQLTACPGMKILRPNIDRLELHEYPKEHVLVLEGENLWFSLKIIVDEGGENQYELINPHNVARNSLQFNFCPSSEVSAAIQNGQRVRITLHTHFMTRVLKSVECKKEPYTLSVRQIQLAKHTPTQVIKLAYLCALLEQQTGAESKPNTPRRLLKLNCFLEEAVKVVPVESVLNAIAYARYDIALECAQALKQSKLTLQPTQQMGKGLCQALFRAMHGISGEVVEDLLHKTDSASDAPVRSTTHSFSWSDMLRGTFGDIPASDTYQTHNTTSHESPMVISPQGNTIGFLHGRNLHPTPLTSQGRNESIVSTPNPLYTQVVSGEASANVQTVLTPRAQSADQSHFHPELLAIQQLNIVLPTVILDPAAFPEAVYFPEDIAQFLKSSLDDLIRRTDILFRNGKKELEVVGKTNLEEIYPTSVTLRRNMHFVSPRTVLARSITKLDNFIKETGMEVNLATPKKTRCNKEMLKLLNGIYNHDVELCAALLGSFMERHIEIPFLKSPEVTVEALSSPIAVGVWALFSVSRENLQKMLESSNNTALIVQVKEYMHSVLTDQPKDSNTEESEERMYAGKLQFLLQGMHKTVTASTKYISYSLEYQLCKHLKKINFKKDISVQDLILQWERIFQNDILFHVAESHRPLLARWLKWAILVHDLREVLAEYTCIGVTGLVNSGKSLLVKQLFNLKKVQVGTLKSKQTTVPLLYNLHFGPLDVIDFPGLDDNDESVPELAELMLTLSQIIVFVVDYRRVSATAINLWLNKIKSGVPVLVCLTHADSLYLECTEREKQYNIEKVETKEKALKNELQIYKEVIGRHHSWDVDFFSFAQVPTVSKDDLKAVGIKSHVEVGEWIADTLKRKLDQTELADKLQSFFLQRSINDASCSSQ